ncbi:heme/hemin ABC transporter substrate-binding protein [Vulgatibacter incomptus]|uniref:Periplasmic hemin-binding protein n=1 Tax=Vulgatibacter incomptus TaxID=1391653 RepID=A0A0K1PBQ4_9BACT|nr:ABC transporter substrate-binding protein [Vulgatibacter incomptus]AKU90968.1 Periplasmic hemin-binding protein [Vulgatibacter incomptus]
MIAGFLLIALAASSPASAADPAQARIVTLGGPVTEAVFALAAGSRVVGVDDSSQAVEGAAALPKVGYYRTVGAEGILSLRPTLVIATEEAGPKAALDQLRSAGVPVLLLPAEATVEGAKRRIRAVAEALDLRAEGAALLARMDVDLAEAASQIGSSSDHPKVLFLFAPGQNALSASGRGTAADEMIRLAGATNAIDGYQGYKPLSAEAAIAAQPMVILVTTSTLARLGGKPGVLALPGLSATPAGRAGRVVALEDLFLLGFGPRTGAAVKALAEQLRGADVQ